MQRSSLERERREVKVGDSRKEGVLVPEWGGVVREVRASLVIRLLRATLFLIAPGLEVLHSVDE